MGHKSSLDATKASEKEESTLRDLTAALQDFTNKELVQVLQHRTEEDGKRSQCELGSDTTNTQLTVDLYTSHFSLHKAIVSVSTSDLLDLADMLWKYTGKSTAEELDNVKKINLDKFEYDSVC